MEADDDSIGILYVGDAEASDGAIGASLDRADERFVVRTAARPADGLARLSDESFDCIVSEYAFPGTDGEIPVDRYNRPYQASNSETTTTAAVLQVTPTAVGGSSASGPATTS